MEFKFNGYCPIFGKDIAEGLCVEIVYELSELKKEEHVPYIKKHIRKEYSNNDIYQICLQCKNSPKDWTDK